ncbi:type IV pilus biogenesis factor PilY1 [Betaproteobacteria bacterium]|nr:type IV pilus biogenesis factor PilY1 [Betaproteobacteria bacterium]
MACGGNALAALSIPNVPLTVGANVPANLLYIHDDSGSMHFSSMPDEVPLTESAITNYPINRAYYNPNFKYDPPPAPPGVTISGAVPVGTLGNASFTNAWFDGYDIAGRNDGNNTYCSSGYNTVYRRVDLSSNFKPTLWYGCYFDLILSPPPGPTYSIGGDYYPDFVTTTGEPAYYRDASGGKHVITTAAEKQNFANWYSYYRTRNYTARAGVAFAFVTLDSNIRVGWGGINQGIKMNYANGIISGYNKTTVDGKSVYGVKEGVRPFDDARKKKFMEWLYKDARPVGNTPLRHALDGAGQYYDRSGSGGLGPWADDPANPGTLDTEPSAACRKSFTILMTDGYWNVGMDPAATTAATLDTDSAAFTPPPKADGSAGSGPITSTLPFKDGYSNTLADVAWYYWARDLLPAPNKVPSNATARDQAWWQHMTTFTIGLGVNPAKANKTSAFNAITTGSAPNFTWHDGKDYQIDDLLHAGVNGHGDFFSANNPQEFATSMQAIINAIGDSAGSSAKLGTNEVAQGASGASAARVFNSSFKTDKWSGDLASQVVSVITETNTNALGTSEWNAAAKLPAPGARRIFTRSDGTGITFNWANLNTTQKAALSEGNADPHGEDVLAFLRGDKANEVKTGLGGSFRDRYRDQSSASTLGDSPHNTPHYHAATKTVYQGANDGMLHAFDAETGEERFAYIPSALFPRLPLLAHTDYGHAYYVDGEAVVADSASAAASIHMLVGALGRGGKGLYGLDVTTPASFGVGNVKWEFNAPATCATTDSDDIKDLGLIFGIPITAKLSGSGNKVVIVGNGYNSCSGKAALYFIDAVTGAVEQKVVVDGGPDNGLSTPFAYDANNDGIPDAIYAGDLNGNLWRFEDVGGKWSARFGGAAVPMLVAKIGSAVPQPITAAPFAVKNETDGKVWVFFGTGQLLQSDDKENQEVQSLYALIDDGNATITRTDLKQRHFTTAAAGTLSDGTPVTLRYADQATAGDMDSFRGWYIDFNLGADDQGERIVSPVRVLKGGSAFILEAMSNIPTKNPCNKGGRSNMISINPFTGGELAFPYMDINGDGKVDSGDKKDGRVPGSIGFSFVAELPPPPPNLCQSDSAVFPGTGAETASTARGGGHIPGCSSRGIKGRVSWRELIN